MSQKTGELACVEAEARCCRVALVCFREGTIGAALTTMAAGSEGLEAYCCFDFVHWTRSVLKQMSVTWKMKLWKEETAQGVWTVRGGKNHVKASHHFPLQSTMKFWYTQMGK